MAAMRDFAEQAQHPIWTERAAGELASVRHELCRTPGALDAWDELVMRLPGAHYLQLHGWLSSYEAMGFECEVMCQLAGERMVGGAAVVSLKLPLGLGRIFVLPHGPVLADPTPRAWEALMAALDAHFRQRQAIFVQAWPHVARDDANGLESYLRAGYEGPPLFKGHRFSSTLLAVDLARRTEDEILNGFRSETRQHYRRAVKRGLAVRLGRTRDDLRRSYALLEEAGRHHGHRPRPYPSLAIALDRLVARDRGLLVQVWKDDELAGTMLALFAGRIATCYTSAVRRDLHWFCPAEFMHVSAMRLAKERGMEVYDLMNWTSDSVAEFKRGFRPRELDWAAPRTKVYRPRLARLLAWGEKRLRPQLRRIVGWRTARQRASEETTDAA